MEDRITGSFPGGPRRAREGDAPRRAPRLRTVEEIEDARAARTRRRALERRQRWRIAAILLGLAVGFATGAALGVTTRTAGELTEALESERARDAEISQEVNRVLLELWKMEDVEALRSRVP